FAVRWGPGRQARLERRFATSSVGPGRRSPDGVGRALPGKRQADRNLGAAAIGVPLGDRPAVGLCDRLGDGEPQAGPVTNGVVATVEALEQPDAGSFGNTAA